MIAAVFARKRGHPLWRLLPAFLFHDSEILDGSSL
jgi:hypothetical protein